MSVPKFKRRPSGLDYVDNAFELQKNIMNLASKLSARWARIYQQPIDRLACLQASLSIWQMELLHKKRKILLQEDGLL